MKDFDKLKSSTIIVCFSAGQTSAYMTKLILEELGCTPAIRGGLKCHRSKYNRYVFVIFNNTSREDKESLQFVKDCDDNFGFRTIWLEAQINPKGVGPTAKIVSFETCARNWEVFEQFVIKHGLPQPGKRKCSEVLKAQNTQSFIRQHNLGNPPKIIGIRIDEPHRHKFERAAKEKVIWPLTTIWPTTKFEIIHFWNRQSFRLMIKSYEGNCGGCHLKGIRKIMTIVKNTPEKLATDIIMEKRYENHIPDGHNKNGTIKLPIKTHRDYLSTEEIIEMANTEYFDEAIDESMLTEFKKNNDYQLDAHEECGESCEAF